MVFFLQRIQEDSPSSNFLLIKMRSYAAKLVTLFLLLGLGFYLATSSTLLSHGDKKSSSSYVFDCKGVSRRITARKAGNLGSESLAVVEQKPARSRSLRVLLIPPPSPIRNRAKALVAPSAPSPLIS